MIDSIVPVLIANSLITAFVFIGLLMALCYWLGQRLFSGRIHSSALAIGLGLLLAYLGGTITGGNQGLADVSWLTGIGMMGGGMLRDFAIAATASGVQIDEIKRAGNSSLQELLQRQPGIEIGNLGGVGKVSTIGIRGTSATHSIILVDEMQNLNFHELDTIITRVGQDSKIVFCGDFGQTDLTRTNEKINQSSIADFIVVFGFELVSFKYTGFASSGKNLSWLLIFNSARSAIDRASE